MSTGCLLYYVGHHELGLRRRDNAEMQVHIFRKSKPGGEFLQVGGPSGKKRCSRVGGLSASALTRAHFFVEYLLN